MQHPIALASAYLSRTLLSRSDSGTKSRSALLVVAGALFLIATNAIYYSVVGQLVKPANFSGFATVVAVLNLAAVPIGTLQAWSSREALGRRPVFRSRGGRTVLAFSVVSALTVLITRSSLQAYWHFRHPWLIVMCALWLPLATLGALLEGEEIASEKLGSVALSQLTGNGAVRLLAGVASLNVGLGVNGAVAAIVIGQIVTLAMNIGKRFASLPHQRLVNPDIGPVRSRRAIGLQVSALLGFGSLVAVDTVIARHLFSTSTAGVFSVFAIVADVAFVIPTVLGFILYPEVTHFQLARNQTRLQYAQAMKMVLISSAVLAIGIALTGTFLVRVFFGSQYQGDNGVLRVLAVQAVVLALLYITVSFQIARHSWNALWPWAGVIAVIGWSQFSHLNPLALAVLVTGVSVGVVILLFIPTFVGMTTAVTRGKSEYAVGMTLPSMDVDLTVVMPFLNPGPNFLSHVVQCISVLDSLEISYELLAVSDGSSDNSVERLRQLNLTRVRLLEHPTNQGKGAALRTGLQEGRGRYIGFIDADGDIPAELLATFASYIATSDADVIYGSKFHPDSRVVYPLVRRIYSYGYRALVNVLFHIPVTDTQTGIKIVRRELIAAALPRMVEKRFAFDLELFVVAHKLGYDRFVELPVTIGERLTSTVSPRSALDMILDTLAIAYRLRILKFYSRQITTSTGHTPIAIVKENSDSVSLKNTSGETNILLRILILNWRDLGHPGAGGAEVYTHAVAEELVKEGHQVTIFCAAVVGHPEREKVNGVQIVRRGTRYSVYRQARKFYKHEGRGQFDVVIDEINTRPFDAVSWVKDARVIGLAHQVCRELWAYEMPWPISWIGENVLEPKWLKRYHSTPVVTVSSSSEQSLREYGLTNVITIPNGRPADLQRLDIDKEPIPTVLFMGRLENHKRPLDALRAFELLKEEVPNVQMWIIGSGSLEKRLRNEASSSVRFFGHVSNQERNELISRSHVLVVTSIREGWGLVVTEAALLGTPTIAYDVPGLRDSVKSADGKLVPPRPSEMAFALTSYFRNNVTLEVPEGTTAGVLPWSEVAQMVMKNCLSLDRQEFVHHDQ